MVKFSYILFLFSAVLIVSLTYCNRDKKLPASSHAFFTVSEFNKLSRAEQVKNCGGCHPKEYENEMKGPHANSYKRLLGMFEYIHRADFDIQPYCIYVGETKANCMGCHATKNLFQTAFTFNSEQRIADLLNVKRWHPEVREDTTSLITGVDCLTCHYDGNNVVAAKDIRASAVGKANCPSYCSPKKSNILASNVGCLPCHQEQVVDMDNSFVSSAINTTDCNKCHAEYDAQGKFTHYYYWAHDPADKKKPAYLDMFNGISCSINSSRSELTITWNNTLLPHPVSICTELAAFIKVYDSNGKLLVAKTINSNKKPEHDEIVQKYFGGVDKVPGNHSMDISQKGVNTHQFALPLGNAKTKQVKVIIEGIKKEQYWLSDTLGTPIHYREVLL